MIREEKLGMKSHGFWNADWRFVRRDEKISFLHWVCRWFELCCNCISIEFWCYVECKVKRFTRFTLLLMLHFAWTVHVVETFVEEGVQVVLRRILNEPCSLNLKFNTPLKPWMFLAVLWKFSILDVMMISCRRVPGMFKVFLLSLKNPNEFRVWSLGFSIWNEAL